jgi:hypothetical protein
MIALGYNEESHGDDHQQQGNAIEIAREHE